MPDIRVLRESDLRRCVTLDADAVDCVETAFRALATEPIVMPPIMRLDIVENNGEVDVKTAYVPGLDGFAIKISPGFFDNPKIGLPSVNGLMVYFDARTGLVKALLLDNGYLTDVRTAAAGAVAAKWLARDDARTAGIIGAGVQAELQLRALALVRPIESALVWARNPDKARDYAEAMSRELGISVVPSEDARSVVCGSDIVVTTTPSTTPLVEAEWLHPGLHVTAMGSDAEHKNELAPGVLAGADLYVCDRQSQCAVLGELHHAIAAGTVPADRAFPELGAVVAGKAPARTSAEQITVCDLTGTGVQDTAIANYAVRRAAGIGVGATFEN